MNISVVTATQGANLDAVCRMTAMASVTNIRDPPTPERVLATQPDGLQIIIDGGDPLSFVFLKSWYEKHVRHVTRDGQVGLRPDCPIMVVCCCWQGAVDKVAIKTSFPGATAVSVQSDFDHLENLMTVLREQVKVFTTQRQHK